MHPTPSKDQAAEKDAVQCTGVHPTSSEAEVEQVETGGGDASTSKAPPVNETTQSTLPPESNDPGTNTHGGSRAMPFARGCAPGPSEVDELVIPETLTL